MYTPRAARTHRVGPGRATGPGARRRRNPARRRVKHRRRGARVCASSGPDAVRPTGRRVRPTGASCWWTRLATIFLHLSFYPSALAPRRASHLPAAAALAHAAYVAYGQSRGGRRGASRCASPCCRGFRMITFGGREAIASHAINRRARRAARAPPMPRRRTVSPTARASLPSFPGRGVVNAAASEWVLTRGRRRPAIAQTHGRGGRRAPAIARRGRRPRSRASPTPGRRRRWRRVAGVAVASSSPSRPAAALWASRRPRGAATME